jgi:hypothetical protein
MLLAGWATRGRYWDWVSASYAKLEQVERQILEHAVRVPFEMTKVASLGTVVVPCTDEQRRASGEAKDLVLIHGFAGGNAAWATNLESLAKHFNVVRYYDVYEWKRGPSVLTCFCYRSTLSSGLAPAARTAPTFPTMTYVQSCVDTSAITSISNGLYLVL